MKNSKLKFVFIILVVFLCGLFLNNNGLNSNNVYAKKAPMRGVWVSTVSGLDFPSERTTDSGDLKIEIKKTVKQLKEIGFNTVFLQVRPCADSFYDSDVFPWSKYLTGQNGLAPSGRFDPLEYWVDVCHDN